MGPDVDKTPKSGIRARWLRTLIDYLAITAGAVLTAAALDAFLIPGRIAAGGVSGLATIVYHVFGFPVGWTMLAVNVPLFAAALFVIGPGFGIRTVYGSIVVSVAVEALKPWIPSITKTSCSRLYTAELLPGLGSVLRSATVEARAEPIWLQGC